MLSDFICSRFFEWLICLRITDIVELCPGYEVVSFIFLLGVYLSLLKFCAQKWGQSLLWQSWLEVDILQMYLHRNHLNLVQNVNKLREAMKILQWCRAFYRERTLSHCWLRNHVSESLSLPLALFLCPPTPFRGTLPAPALCIEKSIPLRPSGVMWWSYSENRRRNMKSYKNQNKTHVNLEQEIVPEGRNNGATEK